MKDIKLFRKLVKGFAGSFADAIRMLEENKCGDFDCEAQTEIVTKLGIAEDLIYEAIESLKRGC